MKEFLRSFIAVLIFLPFPQNLEAKSWGESIADVEEKADRLWERGRSLGADTILGTALNELDVPRHRCAILGRMLGKAELIKELEYNPEPEISEPPTEEELTSLMYYSRSLSNWVFVAKRTLEKSEFERKQEWNLDCVGRMGIPISAIVDIDDSAANFRVDGTDLHVLGDIESGFSSKLNQLVELNPNIERVVLGSGGGNVAEALQAGFAIRRRGLDTTLSSNCYSACPLVFIGGVRRTIWSPYPKLGFHQMSHSDGTPVRTSDSLYLAMEDYARIMGVDPNFLLASMLRAAPNEMFEPDGEDLCRAAAVTWIQRWCSSEEYQ